MRILLFIAGITTLLNSKDIRKSFHDSMFSEKGLQEIVDNKDYTDNAITKAYKGLAESMLAEYAYLPTTKYSLFKAGKKKIEAAVKSSPNSAEIRYTRLMVQLNAPSMLGYDENIDSDLNYFVKRIKSEVKESYWRAKFVKNLKSCSNITAEQKKKLQNL